MDGMTPAEHVATAHAHTVSAGVHADLAATHLKLARDGTVKMTAPDGGGDDDGEAGRAMTAVTAGLPQSGYAQNRTGFRPGTGAARAYRAATRRR
jgi:hypothetical protein